MWTETLDRKWPKGFFILYTFILHGLGSAIITGGIEFAVAYGMYRHPKHHDQVKMWGFPYTLAGDLVVTIFVQIIATWFIEELFVGWDWFLNSSCHIPFWKNKSKGRVALWLDVKTCTFIPRRQIKQEYIKNHNGIGLFWYVIRLQFFRSVKEKQIEPKFNLKIFIIWIIRRLIRSVIISLICFLIIWPVTLGIMTARSLDHVHNDFIFKDYPFPQVLKVIFGAVLAFLTTPITVITIIARNDNYLRLVETNEIQDPLYQFKDEIDSGEQDEDASNDVRDEDEEGKDSEES